MQLCSGSKTYVQYLAANQQKLKMDFAWLP